MSDAMAEIGIGLADAIANIRTELERALAGGQESRIGFTPGAVELEFQVGFQATAAAGGKVRVWVASLDAKGEAVHSGTHRLKLALTPVVRGASPSDNLISDVGSR